MCDCRKDIEQRLKDHHAAQTPNARDHKAELKGYAFTLGEALAIVPYMPVELTAIHPLKSGGEKSKTSKIGMFFTYCPFCGDKLKKDEEPKAVAA